MKHKPQNIYPYTKNNHFKFGYNDKPFFDLRSSPNDQFQAVYGSMTTNVKNWAEANQLAAKEIYDQKVGDVVILLSGGLDSEICLRSFHDQNLRYKTVTLKYKGGFNAAELQFVDQLKSELGFKNEVIDLDLESFWSSQDFRNIVEPIQCVSPILGCHLWLANQVVGTPVIAQGEALLVKKVSSDYQPGISPYPRSEWYLEESEMFCSLYSHFIINNRPGVPGFFQFLPEQTSSYLFHNPYLQRLVNDEVIGKLSTRSSKNSISYQFYPNLVPRKKLTGFEGIMELQLEIRNGLAKKFPYSESKVHFSMQEMHEMLHKIE